MNKQYKVTNRSSSLVFYSIPEKHIHRKFMVGETKTIDYDELEALSFQPGGPSLIRNYLYIADAEVAAEFSGTLEPEYYLDKAGVEKLILTGTLDEFLDCLDFAPSGVIDLIKKYAIALPLNDVAKREALLKKTQFDVDNILRNQKLAKEDELNIEQPAPQRRVKTAENAGRRTTPTYKVVSQETPKGV